jgi:hypothetical protein
MPSCSIKHVFMSYLHVFMFEKALAMQDKRSEVVDKVLAVNEKLLANNAVDWPAARQSLCVLLNDLLDQSADHPAVARVRDFIALHDLQSSVGKEQITKKTRTLGADW